MDKNYIAARTNFVPLDKLESESDRAATQTFAACKLEAFLLSCSCLSKIMS